MSRVPHRSDDPPDDPAFPEECPCGQPNADEDSGDWVCVAAPGFCSEACQAEYTRRVAEEAEAEAMQMCAEDALAATMLRCEHNQILFTGEASGYAPDIVIDVQCRLCGASGSVRIEPKGGVW